MGFVQTARVKSDDPVDSSLNSDVILTAVTAPVFLTVSLLRYIIMIYTAAVNYYYESTWIRILTQMLIYVAWIKVVVYIYAST